MKSIKKFRPHWKLKNTKDIIASDYNLIDVKKLHRRVNTRAYSRLYRKKVVPLHSKRRKTFFVKTYNHK